MQIEPISLTIGWYWGYRIGLFALHLLVGLYAANKLLKCRAITIGVNKMIYADLIYFSLLLAGLEASIMFIIFGLSQNLRVFAVSLSFFILSWMLYLLGAIVVIAHKRTEWIEF